MSEDRKGTGPSTAVEDFLKAVYVLQQQMDRVSTNALADSLNIAPPSVTDMARRMTREGLIDYQRYRGVLLTDEGEAIALRVIRRHRLIELFLVEELGYELYEVHDEAERLEHAVSDRFIQAIMHKLNNPQVDPHGDPIPTVDGVITRPETTPLSELAPNAEATVSRFIAEHSEMLQHILDRGFKLGSHVKVRTADPFEGPLTVLVDGEERVIGYTVATSILVEVDTKPIHDDG